MVLTNNLKAHWRLEESSGTRFDSHVGGYHLSSTGVNDPTGVAAKQGNGLQIIENTIINNTNGTAFSPGSSNFSFAYWFKTPATFDNVVVSQTYIIVTYPAVEGYGSRILFVPGSYTTPAFSVSVFNAIQSLEISTNGLLSVDTSTWYFVVGRLNHELNNGRMELWVNNSLISYQNDMNDNFSTLNVSSGAEMYITTTNLYSPPISGIQDETSIWVGRSITNSEISRLYNNGEGIAWPWPSTFAPKRSQSIIIY